MSEKDSREDTIKTFELFVDPNEAQQGGIGNVVTLDSLKAVAQVQ
jgi:hypothetical protein